MKQSELIEYQLEFDRRANKTDFRNAEKLRKKFVQDYSKNKIKKLELDQYVYNSDNETFCYRVQEELKGLGGSKPKNYRKTYGIHRPQSTKKYEISKKSLGEDIDEAFESIRSAILEIIEYDSKEDDFKKLKVNKLSPMFKGKLLSIYHPKDFLNIYSRSHLDYFINCLGLPNTSDSELDKQALLLKFKNKDEVMKDWNIYEFNEFLYYSFGKPKDGSKSKGAKENGSFTESLSYRIGKNHLFGF